MPKSKKSDSRMQLNILHIPNFLIFPQEIALLNTKDPKIIDQMNKVMALKVPEIGILPAMQDRINFKDRIGILCVVDEDKTEKIKHKGEEVRVYPLMGKQKFRVLNVLEFEEINDSSCPILAEVEIIEEKKISQKSLSPRFLTRLKRVIKIFRSSNPSAIPSPRKLACLDVGELAYFIVGCEIELWDYNRLDFLENLDPLFRLKEILEIVEENLDLENDGGFSFESDSGPDSNLDGSVDEKQEKNLDDLKKKFEEIKGRFPADGLNNITNEFSRLNIMNSDHRDYEVSLDYVRHVVNLFSLNSTEDCKDLKKARIVLDQDHFGLEKVKDRIEEDVAVRIANPTQKAPILCFLGPPGVGKTSLGKSIARALNKKFIRMSLGGLKDEAEIRGHRRTYVGAIPGRIINAIKNCGAVNPVFMLDEIDKIGLDFRGDPAAALLEALDPEQNHSFCDHYTEIPFDLSKVFFIVTANTEEPIPPALRDRLEILRLPGYTEEEKLGIAKNFLVPKQLAEKGLTGKAVAEFESGAVLRIIREYADEAGVRNLERAIADICRKLIHKLVANGSLGESGNFFAILPDSIPAYLGPKRYFLEETEENQPGVVNGLAWTECGGEVLLIEADILEKGKGELVLTGSLGAVMKESARVALTLLRSGKHTDMREKVRNDIHLHSPAGATPKEGPSAGLAFFLCLYSFVKQMPISSHLALTGEVDIKRRVLPVGGIREKLIGADRAGITEVILPKKNEGDLIDLPPSLKKKIEAGEFKIHLVKKVDEALEIVFPQRAEKT